MIERVLSQMREAGWSVLGHHDETVRGRLATFWKMTDGRGRIVVGEAETDLAALIDVRDRIGLPSDPVAVREDAWIATRDEDGGVAIRPRSGDSDVALRLEGGSGDPDAALALAEILARRLGAADAGDRGGRT